MSNIESFLPIPNRAADWKAVPALVIIRVSVNILDPSRWPWGSRRITGVEHWARIWMVT